MLFICDLLALMAMVYSDRQATRDKAEQLALKLQQMTHRAEMLMTEIDFHNDVQALVEFTLEECSQEGAEETRFSIVSQNQQSIEVDDHHTLIDKEMLLKLIFTFPFNSLRVISSQGSTAGEKELFDKNDLSFVELLSLLSSGGIFKENTVYKGDSSLEGRKVGFALARVRGTKLNFLLSVFKK